MDFFQVLDLLLMDSCIVRFWYHEIQIVHEIWPATPHQTHTQTKTAKVIVDSRQQLNRSPTLEHGWNGPNCQHQNLCWAIPVLPLKRCDGTTRQDGLGLAAI